MYSLEEVLIAPIIPFITFVELPVGGQKSMQGDTSHVPVDVDTTVNNLPHTLDDMQTKIQKNTRWNSLLKKYAQLLVLKHYIICEKQVTCSNIETFILMTHGYNKFTFQRVKIEFICIMLME